MTPFVFQWPAMLWLLLLVPPLAWLLHRARRRRAGLAAGMGDAPLVSRRRPDILRIVQYTRRRALFTDAELGVSARAFVLSEAQIDSGNLFYVDRSQIGRAFAGRDAGAALSGQFDAFDFGLSITD